MQHSNAICDVPKRGGGYEMIEMKVQLLVKNKYWISAIFCSAISLLAQASSAQVGTASQTPAVQSDTGFRQYLSEVRIRAAREGVSASTLDRVLPSLNYNEKVVRLDRSQPEGPTDAPIPNFAPYKAQHVDSSRISRGRSKYSELRPVLSRIEAETGVPEAVMIAIYGHETNYGTITGNYNAPEALASLAYEGRRRALFEAELIAVLKMIDRGVPQYAITGSWAGALGKPQFLPSVYLKLARDGDGDGYADIWKSEVDAMTSIANYFVNAGWRRGEEWGFAVNVPATLDRPAIKARTTAPRCPRVFARHSQWKTVAEWRQLGISPQRGFWPKDSMMVTLIEPDGFGNTAYLLGGNYRVILDYNCSNFYALSVGLLADAVRN
jgi:membrane-bound lytic murein transglycosylase B